MILPTLSGPHVPRFVASGDFSVQPYIVTEYIGGQSLRARLPEAPLHFEEVASIGARVAAALHDLHGQYVIHLDLKPSNVMFRESGEAVLIDFGLSRHDRLPDLLAEEFRAADGHGPLHLAGTGPAGPQRGEERSLRPGSRPLLPGHARASLRKPDEPAGAGGSALPRSRPAAHAHADRPSVAAGNHPAMPGGGPARRLRHRGPARLPAPAPRAGRFDCESSAPRARRFHGCREAAFRTIGAEPNPQQSASGQLSQAPIIVVAVDLAQGSEALAEALRLAARRVLRTESGARLVASRS